MMKSGIRLFSGALLGICIMFSSGAAPVKPARRPPAPPKWTARYGMWGITIDPAGKEYPLLAEELQLARELGVSMVRFTFDWATLSPNPNRLNYQRFNTALREADRQKLKVVGVFGGARPPYVKTPGAVMPGAKEFDASLYDGFLFYVEETVRQHRNRIRCWELLDRIDPQFSPEQYRKLAADMISVIRKVDASLTILPPPADPAALPQLRAMMTVGTGKVFDALNTDLLACSTDLELSLPAFQQNRISPAASRLPVWVTRIGYPGGETGYAYRYLMHEFCRAGALSPGGTELLLLADAGKRCFTEQFNFRHFMLGKFRKVTEIPCSQIPKLDPAARQILVLPPRVTLPKQDEEAIITYLKRGGRLFVPHDNDSFFSPERLKQLHIGIEKEGVYQRLIAGPGFPDMPELPEWREPQRFQGITSYQLHPGDRFLSLVQLSSGKISTTAVAVISYGSDLKGRLLWIRGSVEGFGSSCTPDLQARKLSRDLILCRAKGAVKLFYYRMTALGESGAKDQHYGILTRNLEKKPAYAAYQTLIRMMPDGSSRPAVSLIGRDVWLATWRRPDKSTVHALWSRLNGRRVRLHLPAGEKIRESYSFTGQKIQIRPQELWISDGITYLAAPAELKVTLL